MQKFTLREGIAPYPSGTLLGVVCLIEAFNEDKTNGSEPYREAVLQLGGRVVNHLSERLTHYICSNPDPKRLIAAKMLRLFVVSPLWIEQSRELGKRAPEKDFTVTSQLVEDIRIAVRSSALRLPQSEHIREPIPNRAASTRSIDSPFFSSSQRDPSTSCSHPIPAPVPAPVPAGTLSMPSKADHTEDQPFARPVPIPLFREYKPPEIKDTSKFARRRSDRLCDLDESDEDDSNDEEFAKEAGENNDSLTLPSLQQVMTIPRNRRLPVIYVNESSEEALSKFKKSLYEESLSDKERRRIRAQTTKKNQKDAKKFANPPQALKNNDYPKSSSRDKAAPSSTGSAKKEIDKVEMNRLTNKIREYDRLTHLTDEYLHGIVSFQYQSSNEARQAACSTPSGKKEKVIVALTGYDKENGEYDTTCEAVRSLVTVISNKKGQLPAGYSTNENSTIDPYETSVEVVRDSEARQRDFTHLVVGKYTDKRTLRILYALARNVYIIKDDWIYDCICSDCWVDPMDHRLERYSSMICGGEPLRLFKNKLFCLLHSRKPENKILIDLIEIAGGRVTTDVFTEEKVNYYLVGDRDDLRDWLLAHMRNKSHDIVQAVIANAGTHMQLVTCKYIFNCLEEQNVRYALKREEESYSQIDMQELEAEITLALKDRRCMDAIMSRSKNITIKQEHDGQRCIKYSGETLMSPKRPAPSSSSSKTNISNEVFKNKKICVLKISDPTEQQQLVASIEAAQGCITGDVSTSERLHYFLVRNRDDFKAWLLEQEPDIIQHIKTVITNEKTQIVTAKFIRCMLKEQTLRYAVKRNEEALSHIDIAEILEQNQSPENADETNYFQLNNEEPHRFETLTASNRNNELRIGKRKDSAIAEEIDLINSPKKAKLSIFSSPMSVQDGEMVAAIHQQRIEKAEEMASPSSASTSIFSGVAETIKSFLGKITNSAVKENPKVEDESSHGRTMGTQVAVDSLIMLASVDKGDDNDYHVSSPLPTKRVDYPVFDLSKADDDYDMLIRSPEEDANRYKISGKGRLRKSSSSRLSIDDDWQ